MPASDGAAFRQVLDYLGRAIIDGRMGAGDTDTVDAIVARSGASRPVVREATRVLVSLGMLTAGRRVGLRVRPQSGTYSTRS
jgi:DNA-binding FadR family transcriptional regulator